MTSLLAVVLIATPVFCLVYAYLLYPALLVAVTSGRARPTTSDPAEWPEITILLPVYNEAQSISATIEAVLALDYPAARRHVLVVSDASTDGTDELVRGFAGRSVELVRAAERGGKTAAENLAAAHYRGSIVVNMDATIRVVPGALKALVRAFEDPTVGVASGRDVSVSSLAANANAGEGGYVGYEMWLRGLETRLGSIVGASGCFFASRRHLAESRFSPSLSKDFAMPLRARRAGFRSVSVDEALCYVKRVSSLQREYGRKVRTMARGLRTLWHERALLNPLTYGAFAWMLLSHKLVRWLVFLTVPFAFVGLLMLAPTSLPAAVLLGLGVGAALLGFAAMRWSARVEPPRVLAILGYLTASHAAGFMAWITAARGTSLSVWEPTRR